MVRLPILKLILIFAEFLAESASWATNSLIIKSTVAESVRQTEAILFELITVT